jgi:hypothetical protein
MSIARRGRRAAVPIAVAAVAATLLGLMLLVPPGPAVGADAPKATAGYQTTEQLVLAVDLPALKDGKRPALTVELLGPDGKVVDKQSPALPGPEAASLRVAFKRPGLRADQLTAQITSAGKSVRVALNKILLSRAHETTLSTSTEFFAGSDAALRCAVRGVKTLTETVPLAADITVQMRVQAGKPLTLCKGKTGADGVANVRFKVPDLPAGSYELEVLTRSALGEETLKRSVNVRSTAKVLLTTDKPLYQPGQTVHIRALALRAFDLAPAAGDVTLEVEDGKGNKVFKKTLKASDYGLVHTDFTLADEVNLGDWRVRAILGQHHAEKTVAVKRYVLPRFKTQLKTERTFYLPKETVKGELQVDYFFGKPVAGGTVEVKASTFDVAFKEFATFKGKTDKRGHVKFEVKLPDYFVGLPLTKGNAVVRLEAKVTDTAEHTESVSRMVPVSDRPIRVSLIPEAGRLVPGLENTLFVAALYPDGSPASCSVDVWLGQKAQGKPIASLKTNQAGLAEMKLTPKPEQFRTGAWGQHNIEMLGGTQQRWMPSNLFDLTAEARDTRGNKALSVAQLTSEPLGDNVLLRLDRAIYKGGDRLKVDVRSSAGMPTAYVDVIKSGQVMLTRWLDVRDGQARTSIDLPANLFGTLEVHAYQVLGSGEIVRDSRVVYVSPADELKVKVSADRDTYLPGRTATLRFEVSDRSGKPTPSALGVLIVDEAVYALQEMQPGLEKVFFTLQEELLKPRVQVDFKPREGIDGLVLHRKLDDDQQRAARVLLTAVRPKAPARWEVNPEHARRQNLHSKAQLVGQVLFQHAVQNKAVLEKGAKKGTWRFRPALLDELVKAGQLAKEQVNDPMGAPLTFESLAGLMPGFTAERLGRALTQWRMNQLHWMVSQYAHHNATKLKKDNKWVLSETVVDDAIKAARGNPSTLKDAWGKTIAVRPRPKGETNPTGDMVYNDHNLVSAGPDGKFGTKDDVAYRFPFNYWEQLSFWWEHEGTRAVQHPNLAWRNGLGKWDMAWGGRFGRGGMPMGGVGGGVRLARAGGMPVPATAARRTPAFREMLRDGDDKGKDKAAAGPGGGGDGPAPPRLREYFPETLLWRPALITDDNGRATLEVPMADSITTWRLSASASSRSGLLGGATAPLRVFQDFFVELDLPVALTQNDEVAFPVAVFNYLREKQTVTLSLKKEPWFDLLDGDLKRTLTLDAGEVAALKFRIKAKRVGTLPLEVEARGSKMADAVRRQIEVLPDGKPVEQVFTDRLKGSVNHKVHVPAGAIDGASRLYVKVYPGVVSQVMEGLEGMLRLPGG